MARPRSPVAPGLEQVNTHWDPVAWKAGGGALDRAELLGALARHAEDLFAGDADAGEPFGLLTHHLVHDAWTWRIVEEAVAMLASHPAVAFMNARAAFGFPHPRHTEASA